MIGDAQLVELVRAVRAGDRAAQRSATALAVDVPGVTTATTLGLLRDAARANQAVLLGYVNAQGTASQRIVEPVSVNGGYLHGYDHQRDEMRTFSLHRITAVSVLPEDARPEDDLPADARPQDTRPADTRPADTLPADTRPEDALAADSRREDGRPGRTSQSRA
jgi:predicted DNA-binding transcriptional regulator YafY